MFSYHVGVFSAVPTGGAESRRSNASKPSQNSPPAYKPANPSSRSNSLLTWYSHLRSLCCRYACPWFPALARSLRKVLAFASPDRISASHKGLLLRTSHRVHRQLAIAQLLRGIYLRWTLLKELGIVYCQSCVGDIELRKRAQGGEGHRESCFEHARPISVRNIDQRHDTQHLISKTIISWLRKR